MVGFPTHTSATSVHSVDALRTQTHAVKLRDRKVSVFLPLSPGLKIIISQCTRGFGEAVAYALCVNDFAKAIQMQSSFGFIPEGFTEVADGAPDNEVTAPAWQRLLQGGKNTVEKVCA